MITRALRQAEVADRRLRFANMPSGLVVLGMVLMRVGVILSGSPRHCLRMAGLQCSFLYWSFPVIPGSSLHWVCSWP